MITKYFTKIFVRFDPFNKQARTPRLFLAAIPPRQRLTGTKIQYEIIDSSTPADRKHPLIKVTYKDKKEMEVDTSNMTFQEVSNFFDGHSRKLRIKEAVESQ